MKKYLLAGIALLVVVLVGVFFISKNNSAQSQGQPVSAGGASATWCIFKTQSPKVCYDPIAITQGSTALDNFTALADREDSLTFTTSEYEGLGAYVDSINGQAANDQHFWKLQMNGADAQEGISSIMPQAGDTFTFVYTPIINPQ